MGRVTFAVIRAAVAASLISFPSAVADDFASWMEDPDGILLWVSVPRDALVGERITLTITIENTRQGAAFYLEDIDVAGSYVKGFSIMDVQPTPLDRYVIDGDMTLEYHRQIPAGSSQQVYIDLKPETRGVYSGDVDVWGTEEQEQGRFCTGRAQTTVE